MRYLTIGEVLVLYKLIMNQTGGKFGIHDISGLESALAQPRMTFSGIELYPSVEEKAAALGFSLIRNHPFADGNKRIGHAAMELFLILNNLEMAASTNEQEKVILAVASGKMNLKDFTNWIASNLVYREGL